MTSLAAQISRRLFSASLITAFLPAFLSVFAASAAEPALRHAPFQSIDIAGTENGHPWNTTVTPDAAATWQADVMPNVMRFSVKTGKGVRDKDLSMDAQLVLRMGCAGIILNDWQEAASKPWHLARQGTAFTLDERYKQTMQTEPVPFPAYSRQDLAREIGQKFGQTDLPSAYDPSRCAPVVWGEKYTLTYRSQVVQTLYVPLDSSPMPKAPLDQAQLGLRIANALRMQPAPEYTAAKVWPGDPSRLIFAAGVLHAREGEPDYGVETYDLHLLALKAGDHTVLASYVQAGAYTSDAIHLDSIGIDTANYALAPGVRGFGIASHFAHHGCAAYEGEDLSLFIVDGHAIRPVLPGIGVTKSQGMCGTCGDYSHSDSILAVAKTSSKGFADLIVKTRSTSAGPGTIQGEECIAPEESGKTTDVLRFDGSQYVIPPSLQPLSQ